MNWNNLDERQEIILSKYTKPGETVDQFLDRISMGDKDLREIFERGEALWGGRNLYAIGRDGNITGSNCYVTKDPDDSLEGVYRADYEIAKTYSYGGGQGMNLSQLRPKDAKVNNTSNTSPGPMVFAEKYSHTTLNTQQHKRRGALMLVMNDDHPDIIDFITSKLDLEKINGANISIAISSEFMEAYKNDKMWELKFITPHEEIVKRVKARELMKLIAYTNHTMGDPGMLFIDKVNDYHLLSEYEDVKFTATNPCGEQPLMEYGSCNLGSINLFAFVREPFTENAYFDYDRFEEVVASMTWGLDRLLDELGDRHPLQEQRDHVKDWREIGLGVMGLADLALGMRMAYGSIEFIGILNEIMKHMINVAVQASAFRASLTNSFPKYDAKLIKNSEFYKKVLTPETKKLVDKWGLRNSRLLSIAPTGSISNLLGVSGGVEPFYMLGYNRTIQSMFENERTITVWEKTPKLLAQHLGIELMDDLPEWAKVTSQNMSTDKRIQVQSTIQTYVDTAISSTFNLPNSATLRDVMDIYETAHDKGLKGITVFRDNCAKLGILTGVGSEHQDQNPAVPPTVTVVETWTDLKTGQVEKYRSVLRFDTELDSKVETDKIEVCPECGSVLVKRGGCTKCSNEECWYEKCAL